MTDEFKKVTYGTDAQWRAFINWTDREVKRMRHERDNPPTDHLGRDDKDFAIEFGEYLAKSAEQFLAVINDQLQLDADDVLLDNVVRDHWRALESAIYEFRKRAKRAK